MTTITIDRATVEQALEAMEEACEIIGAAWAWRDEKGKPTITALRAALAQPAEPVEPVGTFLVTGNEFCGAPPAPYATWGDALASMFAAGTVQGLRISALAQQAEPVAWAFRHSDGTYHDPSVTEHSAGMVPLYTTPPQRKPLTDEEIDRATAQARDALLDHIYEYGTAAEGVLERIRKLCRAVERALEEKNCGR